MKLWTSEYTYNHPWETIAQAAWRKYPNPMTPSVVGIDVLDRRVEKGVLHSHRLLQSKWYVPAWATALIGASNLCLATEHSTVDPARKEMVLRTVNMTFSSNITVHETLTYAPHPNDPAKTMLKQEARVMVEGVPFANYMEDLLASNISSNAQKGRQGLEWVIKNITDEVARIPEFVAKNTEELIAHTRRSLDDMAEAARISMKIT